MKISTKNSNLISWAILAIAVVYVATTLNIIPTSWLGAGTGGGGQNIIVNTQSNQAGLSVTCYDKTKDSTTGGVPATVQVFAGATKVAEQDTNTGVYSWDVQQGFTSGAVMSVRCYNNSDDGSYESRQDVTLQAGMNAVNVPVAKVGDPRLTVYDNSNAKAITLGSNDRQSIKFDLDTDNSQEVYYLPVMGFKNNATNGASALDAISTIDISGGTQVGCDAYALNGYSKCVQLARTDVSSASPISGGLMYFETGATDPAGVIDIKLVDGVPNGVAGQASINRADSYDNDGEATEYIIVT